MPSSSFEALGSSLLLMLASSMYKYSVVVTLVVVASGKVLVAVLEAGVVGGTAVLVEYCCSELAVEAVDRVPGEFVVVIGTALVVLEDVDIVVVVIGTALVVLEDVDVEVTAVLVDPRAVDTQTRSFEPDAAASATPYCPPLPLYETAAILLDSLPTNGIDHTSCTLTPAPSSNSWKLTRFCRFSSNSTASLMPSPFRSPLIAVSRYLQPIS